MSTDRKLPPGWRAVRGPLGTEYVRTADGARVYQHPARPFRPRIWCAHPPQWKHGDYIGDRRSEAIAYVERHYPIVSTVTNP